MIADNVCNTGKLEPEVVTFDVKSKKIQGQIHKWSY